MRRLRKRVLAKLNGCRYSCCSDGFWEMETLDGSFGCASTDALSDDDFKKVLKYISSHSDSSAQRKTN